MSLFCQEGDDSILIDWYMIYEVVMYCYILFKVINTLYPKSHLSPTVNIESGLGLLGMVGAIICVKILKLISFSLRDPVLKI